MLKAYCKLGIVIFDILKGLSAINNVIKANLQQIKGASEVLTVEPWVHRGKLRIRGELISNSISELPITFIIISKGVNILQLSNFRSWDVAKMEGDQWGRPEGIIIVLTYLPCHNPEPPTTREMEECRADGSQLIIGFDANAHHLT